MNLPKLVPDTTFIIQRTFHAGKSDYYFSGAFLESPHDAYEYKSEGDAEANVRRLVQSDRLHRRNDVQYEVLEYCAEVHLLESEKATLETELARLTTALHAAKAHPDYTYQVVPKGGMRRACQPGGWTTFDGKNQLNAKDWEPCPEADIVPSDECWRRRKRPESTKNDPLPHS